MEGEKIESVLARASELRSKINNCIDRCCLKGGEADSCGGLGGAEEEEEAGSLLNILDALESLEQQLVTLQDLQQQQRYERESTLAQIDSSRKVLLSKLKEYKGEDLEVIHEASAFAGGTIEHDDDHLLPPYPSHLPDSFVLDDLYPSSHLTSKHKFSRNRLTDGPVQDTRKDMDEAKKRSSQPLSSNNSKGVRLVGLVAKALLTFVSVISVLQLAGYKPVLRKNGIQLKLLELSHKPEDAKREVSIQCPPGKVLVIEDGKPRCLVKERVEIPFEPDVKAPNISYGFG